VGVCTTPGRGGAAPLLALPLGIGGDGV